jgi:hypothetical protein
LDPLLHKLARRGLILLEQNDERAVQRTRYTTLETIATSPSGTPRHGAQSTRDYCFYSLAELFGLRYLAAFRWTESGFNKEN